MTKKKELVRLRFASAEHRLLVLAFLSRQGISLEAFVNEAVQARLEAIASRLKENVSSVSTCDTTGT